METRLYRKMYVYSQPIRDELVNKMYLTLSNIRFLRIKRVSVIKDMVDAFKDATIMDAKISVSMVNEYGKDELGVDDGGVFRDALSAFWQEFFLSCTMEEQVPCLRHDYQFAEWESVGRILVKGFQQIKYFPHKLCKVVVAVGPVWRKGCVKEYAFGVL